MNIYAVSDLHLSGRCNKPMNIFGEGWEGHLDKIKESWNALVSDDDIVLVCGDISWAMKLEDALYDLNDLKGLKGKKVFCRGNHYYWWNGISRLRQSAPDDSFYFLQNDCVKFENVILAGSRGWCCPGSADFTERDDKLYKREALRFSLAFQQAEQMRGEGDRLLVMIHYPPFNLKREKNLFTDLFEKHGVEKVVFGHVHGSYYFPLKTEMDGIEYLLSSCDKLGFRLVKIL